MLQRPRLAGRLNRSRAPLLQNALTVDATLVGQRQNDEIKRLTQTSLKHMPELGWRLGYPLALLAMAACGVVRYLVFSAAAGSG
jgi:magnesium transporter